MAIVTPMSFSPNGEYFAYSSPDGTLKIWETATTTLKQEYTPSAHLSATCTCLSWGKIKNLETPETPKKRKKRRSSTIVAELELIALGTTSGDILIFSPAKGDLHTQLTGGHTGPVSSICWSSHENRLYTSSHDQHVVEWDVSMSVMTRKWKADKTAVSSLCLCHTERHLLTAGRSIKLWDLDTLQVVQTFTGHATEIFQLIPVECQKCEGKAAVNGDTVEASYLFSAAAGDRLINAWQVSMKAKDKGALASFSLPDEAVCVNYRSPSQVGQTFLLTVVTKSGHVVIFENQLNGHRKKPVSPTVRLQVVSKQSQDAIPHPIPVLSAMVTRDTDRTLMLAYGSFLKPSFETMVHSSLEPDMCLEREDASHSVMKLQQSVSKVKIPDTSQEVTFLAPGHMVPNVPTTGNTETRKEQRKRKKSVDLTMEDRMNAISIDKPSTTRGAKHPPKADGLATLLAQGLKSQDQKILASVLQRRDEALIRSTIRKLPITLIVPLVQELAKRMHSHAQSGVTSLKWVRIVLTLHASYLMSFPGLVDTVSGMYAMMDSRNSVFDKLSQLHGKLDLVLSQISSQEMEEDLDDIQQPMLHFQDDSSDSDYGMDAVVHDHTESEDSWDEMSAGEEETDSKVKRTLNKRKNSERTESEEEDEAMDSDKDG